MSQIDQMNAFFEEENKKIDVLFDDHKFRTKLNIGEDAFKVLQTAKSIKDLAGVVGLGAGVSGLAGGAWFASLGVVGKAALAIGVGSTPVGWIVGAGGLAAAGAYGVKKFIDSMDKDATVKIPKYLNSALDVLASNIAEILLIPAIKMGYADNHFSNVERQRIRGYFASQWGYSKAFIDQKMDEIEPNIHQFDYDMFKDKLHESCDQYKDIQYNYLIDEILVLLKGVMMADGRIDKEEENTLKEFERILKDG